MTIVAPVSYSISAANLNAHLYRVHLKIETPAALQVLSLPVWIPGSYLIREFSRHLQNLRPMQNGNAVLFQQTNKNTWQIACDSGQPLDVEYEVYAFDNSVRTAWLDGERGFFNATSLCLMVHGKEALPHSLHLPAATFPKDWKVATSLRPHAIDERGFNYYLATDYDELADSPVEMGNFWSGEFTIFGVPHQFVVAGAAASFDGERLLADVEKICAQEIAFWHQGAGQPPHDRYVFMLNAVGSGYGGLEHRHSTALICNRDDLPRKNVQKQPEGYVTLLGLISHEYFHTWNVKRMRPSEFAQYNYEQENYTKMLWFFEGITSYYDDLLLLRAGLINREQYLSILAKTINQVAQTPGRKIQSVAQASFDAWIKYYRQEENTLNATVSYYTKGALVALCLDLTLRSEGKTTLDVLMRELWTRHNAGPIQERNVLEALASLAKRTFEQEFEQWIHGTSDLPFDALLKQFGIDIEPQAARWPDSLGLVITESADTGIIVRRVLRDSPAENAGIAVGDELIGIKTANQSWRLKKMAQLEFYTSPDDTELNTILSRDGKIIERLIALDRSYDGAKKIQLITSATSDEKINRLQNNWLNS